MVGGIFMRYIDEIIEKIAGKKGKNTVFAIFIFVCSIVCAIVTQNAWLTLIYTFASFGFDVLAENYEEFSLDTFINWIFGHKVFICVLLIIIALSPTLAYGGIKALKSSGISFCFIKYVLIERLYNLVPNILGASIVCSFMFYLSEIGAEKILCNTIKNRKDFFDIIMRFGFNIAFLNAINHAFRNGYQISDSLNALHLTVAVFGGIVILGAYALWIIGKDDSN